MLALVALIAELWRGLTRPAAIVPDPRPWTDGTDSEQWRNP